MRHVEGDILHMPAGLRRSSLLSLSVVGALVAGSAIAAPAASAAPPTGTVSLSTLAWSAESNGYGPVERDQSNGEAARGDGRTLTVAGVEYARGIGMHATGAVSFALGGNCTAFTTSVGIDDEVRGGAGDPPRSGSVRFQVFGDGRLLAETDVVRNADGAVTLDADVTDVDTLRLVADEAVDGKNYDHADWLDPQLTCADTVPEEPGTAQTWPLTGPDGSSLSATLSLDEAGTVDLAVTRGGETVVTADSLGLVGSDGDFRRGLAFVGRQDRQVSDSYSMLSGKERDRSYLFAESAFTFRSAQGADIRLVVRLSDDGVAYRYELGAGEHRVDDESGSWVFPSDGEAWMQRSYAYNYEAEWMTTTTAAGNGTSGVGYPVLARSGDSHVLITESDVHGDYSATHLTHTPGTPAYGVDLFEGRPVTSSGELTTPWRVAIVGGLSEVVESTLVDDLATPQVSDDTSWIAPGISSWSWVTDPASPRSESRQRDFVDLAARNGWEYVLLDEGWDASWVPRTVRYAESKGVDTIIWLHSRDLRTQAQRDEWLPRIASWGVKGIKVDFMDTDSQEIFQWYDAIAADTAKHHLMINFHGATLPTGMQRTWPHIMAYEAVRGAENGIEPSRSLTVPFTRNIVGSMDWTPVIFSRGNASSSMAQEVAMGIVYESAWQHFSDRPESYAAQPDAERFLQNIPAGPWDETRLLSGDPDSSIVLARSFGDRWFVGGMRAGEGPALDLPLAELGTGTWTTDILTDDGANGSAMVLRSETHDASDVLSIPTARNGGFAVIACPAVPGRDTCLEEPDLLSATTLDVTPATADVPVGSTVEISATFTSLEADAADVQLGLQAPAGWAVEGAPVSQPVLAEDAALTATWRVTVPEGAQGTIELPVVTTFSVDGEERRHADQATVWIAPDPLAEGTHWLSDLEWIEQSNGYGPVERDQSNGQAAANDGRPLEIGGRVFEKGVGMHATGEVTAWLGGTCTEFTAVVGIDDEVLETPGESGTGSVRFSVYGDGELLTETAVVTNDDGAVEIAADVTGVNRLRVVADEATAGKNFDHADWGDAKVVCADEAPEEVVVTTDPAVPNGANGWFTVPVTVTLSADDPIEYALDGGEWTAYSSPLLLQDGAHRLETRTTEELAARAVSAVAVSTLIPIDTTAPEMTVSGITGGVAQETVAWSATDVTSGVGSVSATIDGAPVAGSSVDARRLAVGAHTLRVEAVDNAGLAADPVVVTFVVTAAAVPGALPGSGQGPAASGPLAATGLNAPWLAVSAAALLLVVAGGGALGIRRRMIREG
jgi:hypothetical protein